MRMGGGRRDSLLVVVWRREAWRREGCVWVGGRKFGGGVVWGVKGGVRVDILFEAKIGLEDGGVVDVKGWIASVSFWGGCGV